MALGDKSFSVVSTFENFVSTLRDQAQAVEVEKSILEFALNKNEWLIIRNRFVDYNF